MMINYFPYTRAADKIAQAYLQLVAAKAHVAVDITGRSFDNLGYDAQLALSLPEKEIPVGNTKGIQLKACYSSEKDKYKEVDDNIIYQIGTKAFEKLKYSTNTTYLVLVRLPILAELQDQNNNIPESWITIESERLLMQCCGYYKELKYSEADKNIIVPKSNLLTPESMLDFFPEKNQFNIDFLKTLL